MKRSYLEKVYFKKKTPDSLKKKLKNKRITAAGFTKKSGKNISKILIQEGSVTIRVFGKISNHFSLKSKRLAIRYLSLTIKKTLSLTTICFQRNLINFSKMQPEA